MLNLNSSNPFESELAAVYVLTADRDFPPETRAAFARIMGNATKTPMPTVEDFCALARINSSPVVVCTSDTDCDGTVNTFRVFPGTYWYRDGHKDVGDVWKPARGYDCAWLAPLDSLDLPPLSEWHHASLESEGYIWFDDCHWNPWVFDDTIGIPALDTRYEDDAYSLGSCGFEG